MFGIFACKWIEINQLSKKLLINFILIDNSMNQLIVTALKYIFKNI